MNKTMRQLRMLAALKPCQRSGGLMKSDTI